MKTKFSIFLSLLFSVVLISCGTDNDDAQPAKGSLNVIVSPANAASRINLIRGADTIKAFPDAYGVFTVPNLAENNYNAVFTPTPFYEHPTDKTVQIKAGQVTDLGTISFTKKPDGVFAKVNGDDWKPYYQSNSVKNDTLEIHAWTYGGYGIFFKVPFAVGTHNSTAIPQMQWMYAGAQGGPNSGWYSQFGGKASITITEINRTSRKVSGYFSFTAEPIPGSGATGTLRVTDGVFLNVSY